MYSVSCCACSVCVIEALKRKRRVGFARSERDSERASEDHRVGPGAKVDILKIYDHQEQKCAIAAFVDEADFAYALRRLDKANLNGRRVRCYNERDATPEPELSTATPSPSPSRRENKSDSQSRSRRRVDVVRSTERSRDSKVSHRSLPRSKHSRSHSHEAGSYHANRDLKGDEGKPCSRSRNRSRSRDRIHRNKEQRTPRPKLVRRADGSRNRSRSRSDNFDLRVRV